MRLKSKCYKKFLSCLLAASMVTASGGVQGITAVQAEAADASTYYMLNVDGSMWRIYDNGIVSDESTGLKYVLNEDNTASVFGYLAATKLPSRVTIPNTISVTRSVYNQYWKDAVDMEYASGESAGSVKFDQLKVSSKVTKVADKLFEGLSTLQEVALGSNITAVGDHAFANCANLTKLTIPDSVTVFGLDILTGAKNCTIYCNAGSKAAQYAKEKNYKYNTGDSSEPSSSPSASPEASGTPEPVVTTPTVSATPSSTPGNATAAPSKTPNATIAPTKTPVVADPSKAPNATVTPGATATVAPTPSSTSQTEVTVAPNPGGTTTSAPTRVPQAIGTPVPGVTPQATGTASPTAVPFPGPDTTPQVTGTVKPVPLPQVTAVPAISAEPANPVPVTPETPAEDENKVTQNNVSYEVDTAKGNVSVSDMGNTNKSSVTIPATVTIEGKEYPVTAVDSGAFKGNTTIKSVKLGENIKTIGAGAFRGCTKLTKVVLPSSVKTIGKNSFYNCKSLKTVTIPDSVTSIKKAAFKNCTSLKTLTIGTNPKAKKGAMVIDGKKVMYGAGTVKIDIGAQALANCKNLTSLTINRMVTRIGNSAFKGCTSLSDIIVRSLQLQRVDKGALTGVSNCKISVPTKKVKPYTVLFKNKGQGKKVVVAKI